MRISDWSSDVCSSDLFADPAITAPFALFDRIAADMDRQMDAMFRQARMLEAAAARGATPDRAAFGTLPAGTLSYRFVSTSTGIGTCSRSIQESEEHTSELQSLMRHSYYVFYLTKKTTN